MNKLENSFFERDVLELAFALPPTNRLRALALTMPANGSTSPGDSFPRRSSKGEIRK